jgi:hypothetical protein
MTSDDENVDHLQEYRARIRRLYMNVGRLIPFIADETEMEMDMFRPCPNFVRIGRRESIYIGEGDFYTRQFLPRLSERALAARLLQFEARSEKMRDLSSTFMLMAYLVSLMGGVVFGILVTFDISFDMSWFVFVSLPLVSLSILFVKANKYREKFKRFERLRDRAREIFLDRHCTLEIIRRGTQLHMSPGATWWDREIAGLSADEKNTLESCHSKARVCANGYCNNAIDIDFDGYVSVNMKYYNLRDLMRWWLDDRVQFFCCACIGTNDDFREYRRKLDERIKIENQV